MFFYISFLRTPPHTSSPSSSITITPQVSNDLRTDPFPASVDIFYWWISYAQQQNVIVRLSDPAKLTTWRQENAYKPLQVSPPSQKNHFGTDCCLVLSSSSIISSLIIDLRDPNVGRVPFPVSSLPIQIVIPRATGHGGGGGGGGGRGSIKSAKQEAITRTFRLFHENEDEDASMASANGRGNPPLMQIKEMVSFDLDKKLWDSGIGLSAWLVQLSAAHASPTADTHSSSSFTIVQELEERLFTLEECHIIELGAGTGIVSLVLAALRSAITTNSRRCPASSASFETHIFSTDLPSSMELMDHNIRGNSALYPHCPPRALPLNWDEELPDIVRNVLERRGFDLIVQTHLLTFPFFYFLSRMADVTYNTSSFPALLRTLASLLALSDSRNDDGDHAGGTVVQRGPLVLLAYKERDPGERQLWDMMIAEPEVGVVLECVGKQAGAGGLPVEIWLGRRKRE
ncbi:putative methyltransferase-domain-containing protein [Multifurca ochricompacta]|uniref:Methyltransferase-domain-containing protein n=1 Tax=Multifurca ochricompacta TaxID=376703 RepID=A0AAD4M956_9AGAM|nr:putative methyltransferase-domain-containing protein [Multifurca ochricompacta]